MVMKDTCLLLCVARATAERVRRAAATQFPPTPNAVAGRRGGGVTGETHAQRLSHHECFGMLTAIALFFLQDVSSFLCSPPPQPRTIDLVVQARLPPSAVPKISTRNHRMVLVAAVLLC
eukprot:TRINITY_DN19995_c0_g1_i1.p1 TRINITY_DN19995_c0_g1~~TRINITY_DN19995_c0_g1_i1.p1  ORF type:complete len:119 (-),score=3.18 TRINITY_DN19995_c0_g1_i1:284-640(-)